MLKERINTPDIFENEKEENKDIMGDIMQSRNPESNTPVSTESGNSLNINTESNTCVNTCNHKEVIMEEPREKVTHTLKKSTANLTDKMWMDLRIILKDKVKVSRSLLVEKALDLAFEDFTKHGEKSRFFKAIVNSKKRI